MTPGKVYLVGAGPGDPGLITVKGMRCVETADVVVYDRLVGREILERARPDAELIDVGKVPGESRNPQVKINALLMEKALAGKSVLRLKGGDPFVFGRGGEEAMELASHGVRFEVVPGVTSAIAAPAYAGIPLTHRGVGSHATLVTGSEAPGKAESAVPWEKLASVGGTVVVLMGWESLPEIVDAFIAGGRAPDTPVALVRWGTRPDQATVTGTLSDIVEKGRSAGLSSPVVTVIGEVVSLRDSLRWFDDRPLFGKRVLVTRTRAQAGRLSGLLAEAGATPIEIPSIEIKPLDDYGELDSHLERLGEFDWVVLSSANNVEIVFGRLGALGLDSRALGAVKVAAVGPATAESLTARGITADYVPERYVSEAVVAGMERIGVRGRRILLPRSSAGRELMVSGLTELGAEVVQVAAYRPVPAEGSRERLAEALDQGVDAATFTSSSTVKNLIGFLDGNIGRLAGVTLACIGPVTAQTAADLGLKVDIVASESTIPGLVRDLERFYS